MKPAAPVYLLAGSANLPPRNCRGHSQLLAWSICMLASPLRFPCRPLRTWELSFRARHGGREISQRDPRPGCVEPQDDNTSRLRGRLRSVRFPLQAASGYDGRLIFKAGEVPYARSAGMPVSATNSKLIYDALKGCGIRLMSALPETWLVHLIRLADEDAEMILVRLAKEEEGVGISAGAHFAGVKSAMLMQNHGFLAAVNGIVSFGQLYKIPFTAARNPWFCISMADFTPAKCAPAEMPTPSSSFARRTRIIPASSSASRIKCTNQVSGRADISRMPQPFNAS